MNVTWYHITMISYAYNHMNDCMISCKMLYDIIIIWYHVTCTWYHRHDIMGMLNDIIDQYSWYHMYTISYTLLYMISYSLFHIWHHISLTRYQSTARWYHIFPPLCQVYLDISCQCLEELRWFVVNTPC